MTLDFENIERDYEMRCGNCHAYLPEGDKYCKYCGTERGKGKFEPYENVTYCVYGPQVKKKYKCSGCGHIWITAQMGGDESKYCPQCGKKTVNTIQEDVFWASMFGYVGTKDPFDESERPILLNEAQIDKLLSNVREEDSFMEESSLIEIMKKCDIPTPVDSECAEEGLTEEEGERMTLVERILKMKGSNPKAYKGKYCPHCASSYMAAIGYRVWSKDNNILSECVCVEPDDKDPVIYNKSYRWVLGDDYSDDICPAWFCLRCGTEFGRFKLSKNQEKKLKAENSID